MSRVRISSSAHDTRARESASRSRGPSVVSGYRRRIDGGAGTCAPDRTSARRNGPSAEPRRNTSDVTSRRMLAAVAGAVLVLTGCTTEKDPGPEEPSPQQSPAPQGGTADQPAPLPTTTSLLEWVPAPGAV